MGLLIIADEPFFTPWRASNSSANLSIRGLDMLFRDGSLPLASSTSPRRVDDNGMGCSSISDPDVLDPELGFESKESAAGRPADERVACPTIIAIVPKKINDSAAVTVTYFFITNTPPSYMYPQETS